METPFNPSQPLNRWAVTLFVLFVLSLVIVPVIVAYSPIERARWLVAAADNALENPKEQRKVSMQKAKVLLEQAKKSYPEIENSLEFARTSLFVAHNEELSLAIDSLDFSPESVPLTTEQLDRAMSVVTLSSPLMKAHVANVLGDVLLKMKDYDSAYQILVAGYPTQEKRDAEQRNNLAYYAALANRDLETALEDIEKAMSGKKLGTSEFPMYLDTKAWILFRAQRFEEALTAIDSSIEEYAKDFKETPYKPSVKAIFQDLFNQNPPFTKRPIGDKFDPFEQFSPQIRQILKLIVVTHYHRAEILEGLGRIEEADAEYTWLVDRGFHDFDQLY